jgi:hypothetical protein
VTVFVGIMKFLAMLRLHWKWWENWIKKYKKSTK